MTTTRSSYLAVAGVSLLLAACQVSPGASQSAASRPPVGASDLGGTVTSAGGPEAGVWVIAETTELPTKFTKIVVTDDRGRYLIPELPKANYSVWVRGYGLVDSPKVQAAPGRILDLNAVTAPSAAAAAQYYPAIYWYSMLKVPAKSEFPAGPVKTQPEWVNIIKTSGCMSCHALGTLGTRTMPKDFAHFKSSAEAWGRRIASGQAMTQMVTVLGRLDGPRALALWGDWTDRVAAGELPFAKPERPRGLERNIVLTLWDWSTPTGYMHDLISTDRRKPTVNAYGKLYGATEESTDYFPVLDPNTHTASRLKHPVRDPNTPSSKTAPLAPSPYWGSEPIWDSQTSIHNQMMDEKGRVWATARVRPPANPDYCRKGGSHPSAKVFPLENANRHLSMYDPATGKFTLISTCFPTHHLIFAEDANQTLWASNGVTGPGAVGWLNRKLFEETGDEVRSQGWTPFILDTNGNGKRDEWVEPNQPVDPAKDKRVQVSMYSVVVSPNDGSVWGTSMGFPGHVVRVAPGPDPTHTAITEIYEPEGWTLYRFPGPQFRDVQDDGSVEASYYTWVDWFDSFGLGKNVPIASGNMSDAYFALVEGKWVTLRVPYPMGFYAKWSEGRIDDPNAGWKGRSLWATYSTRAVFHVEGGKENRPRVVKFQLRPDPLVN